MAKPAGDREPEIPSDEMIKSIAAVAGHPEFIKLIEELEAKPPELRMQYAKAYATPTELLRRGIPIPAGFRITTRTFEAPGASTTIHTKIADELSPGGILGSHPKKPKPPPPPVTICVSVGLVLCVSVGSEFIGEEI
jgi:hypothetical protein